MFPSLYFLLFYKNYLIDNETIRNG